MVWVGRDLKDHPVPTPCRAGTPSLNQVAPKFIQPGFEHLGGSGIHSLCGKVRFPLDEGFGERLMNRNNTDKLLEVTAGYVPTADTHRYFICLLGRRRASFGTGNNHPRGILCDFSWFRTRLGTSV